LCDIEFTKVGVERWRVLPTDAGSFYLHPWGNREGGGITN
jgi:hypothetical protein